MDKDVLELINDFFKSLNITDESEVKNNNNNEDEMSVSKLLKESKEELLKRKRLQIFKDMKENNNNAIYVFSEVLKKEKEADMFAKMFGDVLECGDDFEISRISSAIEVASEDFRFVSSYPDYNKNDTKEMLVLLKEYMNNLIDSEIEKRA